ncbi:YitT family protein, partial [Lacticaseibacillus rhamnosus]|uniref:YitT family protein n=1 Tax=Lacticaseibacillus rhamnosus TaxID=47715 RepID=UPI003F461EE7
MIDGGIIGVSLILDHLFMSNPILNFALFVVLLNIPFMIFGYKYIGKTFLISTVIGIVGLALIDPHCIMWRPLRPSLFWRRYSG